jgi:hypothetical protein
MNWIVESGEMEIRLHSYQRLISSHQTNGGTFGVVADHASSHMKQNRNGPRMEASCCQVRIGLFQDPVRRSASVAQKIHTCQSERRGSLIWIVVHHSFNTRGCGRRVLRCVLSDDMQNTTPQRRNVLTSIRKVVLTAVKTDFE